MESSCMVARTRARCKGSWGSVDSLGPAVRVLLRTRTHAALRLPRRRTSLMRRRMLLRALTAARLYSKVARARASLKVRDKGRRDRAVLRDRDSMVAIGSEAASVQLARVVLVEAPSRVHTISNKAVLTSVILKAGTSPTFMDISLGNRVTGSNWGLSLQLSVVFFTLVFFSFFRFF